MTNLPEKLDLLKGMESCRPGSDDLNSPELSQVAEAIRQDEQWEERYRLTQQSDATIAAAFHDVAAPVGFQDRLLAALETNTNEAAVSGSPLQERSQTVAEPLSRKDNPRRWFILAGIAASVMIAAGIGFVIWAQPTAVTQEQVASIATDLHSELDDGSWQSNVEPPSQRSPSGRIRRDVRLVGWKKVEGLGDPSAVAYRYQRNGVTATLFVFRPRAIDARMTNASLDNPMRSSGVTIGVGSTGGGLVYALVVDGGRERYGAFLRDGNWT